MTTIEERARNRNTVVGTLRRFFDDHGFVEVDTPVALSAIAPELHIEAPGVRLHAADGPHARFLQSSPELPMKRLLAMGLPRIYQIAPVFRDGDDSPLHRPEFRLLEWYRRGAAWTELLDDCEALLRACAAALGHGDRLTYQGHPVELSSPFRRVSVDEAFVAHAGFSILDCLEVEPLRQRVLGLGLHVGDDDSWDDLFHRVFLARVEPALLADRTPLFLTHYPAPLAALARLSPDDPRVSERFELYAGGLELANGFGELTDAAEQRRRFERDRQLRRERGLTDYPLDERFLTALDTLPPSAGIALGLERLIMLLVDAETIDATALIPWGDA